MIKTRFTAILVASLCWMNLMATNAPGQPVHGFLDVRGGRRISDDAYQQATSLAETRLQLQWERRADWGDMRLRSDFLYDHVTRRHDVDMERGRGWVDLREAYLFLYPATWTDIKVGRQILTWGTGDLLFINDLFPKDWQSFFLGRDEDYLKAPSDAVLISLFPAMLNIDVVYMPRFDADRAITGERISYYNPMLARRAGRDAVINPQARDDWFEDDELAIRLYGQSGGIEWAGYAYQGYWKSPQGIDPSTQRAMYPRLRVYGASLRTMYAGGIISSEVGYYDALDNQRGNQPGQPNSEIRGLLGWEREVAQNLTLGLQYYLESMLDHAAYRRQLPDDQPQRDRDRHVVATRLTREAFNQKLRLSGFLYYSPSDHDGYLRGTVRYSLSDHWSVACGGNLFAGAHKHTFFGQFRDNSNLYASLRRSF